MTDLWRTLWDTVRDPRLSAALVLGLMTVAGLVLVVVGYRGTSDLARVVYQLPYVISGGIGGIALVGISLALLSIHLDRVEGAEERYELAQVQREIMRLVSASASSRTR